MRLLRIKKLGSGQHKYAAFFEDDDGRQFETKFGGRGYEDYTTHGDEERRARYWSRHRKDLNTRQPWRAGFLSWFILWNRPTFAKSVDDYHRRLKRYNETGYFPISHDWQP